LDPLPHQEVVSMAKKIDLALFAIIIGIAVVLQLALIGVDCRQTPAKIARNFAEAYYYISPDMQDYLCASLIKKGAVDNFIYQKKQEASQRGFATNYLRHKFTKLHLNATKSGDTTMTVHLRGTTRVCIYPPFMIVGKLFGIGRDYPVDTHIDLVKENGQWRVCGNPFGIDPKV
jgi:hypothetical protein